MEKLAPFWMYIQFKIGKNFQRGGYTPPQAGETSTWMCPLLVGLAAGLATRIHSHS